MAEKTGKIAGIVQESGYFWLIPVHWIGNYKRRVLSKLRLDGYITINQVAETLGVSRTRIVALRNQGRIEGAVCVSGTGKRWYIPLAWVEAEKVKRGI